VSLKDTCGLFVFNNLQIPNIKRRNIMTLLNLGTPESFSEKTKEENYLQILRNSPIHQIAYQFNSKRKKLGLSRRKLAKLANVPHVTIVRIENAVANPSLNTLIEIAYALDSCLDIELDSLENVTPVRTPV